VDISEYRRSVLCSTPPFSSACARPECQRNEPAPFPGRRVGQ
jgi:hypothetical protein